MAPSTQELLGDLAALENPAKSPCGCGGASAEPAAAGGGLEADLDAALRELGDGGGELGEVSFDDASLLFEADDLLFGDFEAESNVGLDDLVFLAERYPGLKITISF